MWYKIILMWGDLQKDGFKNCLGSLAFHFKDVFSIGQ